jgi:ParB-like nuclease domain.
MNINLAHKHFDEKHLAEVIEEMKKLGAPTIKVVDMGDDDFQALEGSHRIRAAKELGLTPELEIIDYNDPRTPQEITDLDDNMPIASFCDRAWGNSEIIEF